MGFGLDNSSVLGGLAVYAYGSKRMLVDIDLVMKNEDFQKLLPEVKEYVNGDKGCKFLDSKIGKWQKLGEGLSKPTIKKIFGLELLIIPKKELIAYKKKLMRCVDKIDLKNFGEKVPSK